MPPRLSILCASLESRRGLWPILDDLREQCEGEPAELLVCEDDGERPIGAKLNELLDRASGDYVCIVADDDGVEPDFVEALLLGLETEPDILTFNMNWHGYKGKNVPPSSCGFSVWAAVRREIVSRFRFPHWWQTEDKVYAAFLQRHDPPLEHQHIDRMLAHKYDRPRKPEFGGGRYHPLARRKAGDDIDAHLEKLTR